MRSLIALLIALVLILSPAAAQSDEAAPRLRTAPQDEVLDVLIDLATTYNLNPMKGDDLRLSQAVNAEFEPLLTSPDTDFNTRVRAFTFNGVERWEFSQIDRIAHPLIAQWLTEYQPDFLSTTIHTIGDLTITAAPFDFNTDGTSEWILNVTTESGQYRQILFAAGEIGALELVKSPLPWYGDGFGYSDSPSGFMQPQIFQDMTSDGQPEWILAHGGVGGGHQNFGSLYVLQWRDNQLVDIADIDYSAPAGSGGALFPSGVSLAYRDLDSDGTTEIILTQQRHDNWDCNSEWVTVYAWSPVAAYFIEDGRPTVKFENDSPTCALKNAHIASWEGRYADAVLGYQQFLDAAVTAPEYQPSEYKYDTVLHARVKLALAYAMLGQTDAASDIIDAAMRDLENEPLDFDLMDTVIPELVRAAYEAYQPNRSTLALCAAMYMTFNHDYRYDPLPNPYWGILDYGLAPASSASSAPANLIQASCDAPAMLAAAPDSSGTQAIAELFRAADERYAYGGMVERVRDFALHLTYPHDMQVVSELEALRPAYLDTYSISMEERLELTRADLARFADDPTYGAVVRYHYAWALDDAGFFPDSEVAAAYQFVIDFDPESPWAKLAALHIE